MLFLFSPFQDLVGFEFDNRYLLVLITILVTLCIGRNFCYSIIDSRQLKRTTRNMNQFPFLQVVNVLNSCPTNRFCYCSIGFQCTVHCIFVYCKLWVINLIRSWFLELKYSFSFLQIFSLVNCHHLNRTPKKSDERVAAPFSVDFSQSILLMIFGWFFSVFSFVQLKWKIFGQFDRFLPPSLFNSTGGRKKYPCSHHCLRIVIRTL